MSAHTPGPWKFYRETTVDRGDGYGIKAPAPHNWVIPPLNLDPADVKLMAAAPELLDTLKEFVAWFENGDANNSFLGRARDAIAKAEGK